MDRGKKKGINQMIRRVVSVEKQKITITNLYRTSRDPMKYVNKKLNKKKFRTIISA